MPQLVRARRSAPLRAVAAFLAAGLLAVGLIAVVVVVVQRQASVREAVREARTLTSVEALDVVGPNLTDGALRPGLAQDRLDQLVRSRVLGGGVVRVKIWGMDGTVLYSDDPGVIGHRFTLGSEERQALRTGTAASDISLLSLPENRDDRAFGRLLEVYLGVRTAEGTPVLFETYSRYDVIDASGGVILRNSLPALVAGLGLLYIVQAPLAWRLARRLQRSDRERRRALVSALAAADEERLRIAADLHDGTVQSLAGTSMSLSAGAALADAGGSVEQAVTMRTAASALRTAVRELRTLMVTISPPRLRDEGLDAALHDLAWTLEARGVTTTVDVQPCLELDADAELLLFRAAQEGVRNILKHAGAARAALSVERDDSRVTLQVTDDGTGVPAPRGAADLGEGGAGLGLLARLVDAAGGRLELTANGPGPGGAGSVLTVVLPVRERRRDAALLR